MAALPFIKLNPDNQLLLDQPLLKVPHELARKTHKTAVRYVERERDSILASLKTAATTAATSSSTQPQQDQNPSLASLDNMIARMETLKRKLEALQTEEQTNHKHARARIQHLQDLHDIPSLADVKYDRWAKVRLDRLLVDYLLRYGYGDSARALAKEVKIEELVDVEAFVQCAKVEASLKAGRTQEALAWCSENKQALKKIDNDLEHELRLQQYIELLRTQETPKLIEATANARKYLTSHPDKPFANQAAGLLAFGPDTPFEPYKSLYSSTRYHHLHALFLTTHHQLVSLPPTPPLHIALSAGLSALKTPACHSIHTSHPTNPSLSTSTTNTNTPKNPPTSPSVCPICSTELNELARGVPYAQRTKSSVDEEPVVLPSGRVYGKERLRAGMLGGEEDGGEGAKVRDPVTGEWWGWGEVRRVFVM